MKNLYLLSFGFIMFFVSCKNEIEPKPSFYYWKTIFNLNNEEKNILKENSINKIYIRYFDVALKDNIPLPLLPIIFKEQPENLEIVPVIFIKNEVMLNQSLNTSDLADKIKNLIDQINKKNNLHIKEIQFDCDWSKQSRDNYFAFLSLFKTKFNCSLSATIRLHQIKYLKLAGIPNVDRGVLMYYNMSTLDSNDNLIYDRNIAKEYLKNLKDYPLKLDLALPVYSWIIHRRNNKVLALYSKTDIEQFYLGNNFKTIRNNQVIVKNNLLKDGIFYKKGDIIQIDVVQKKDLYEMIKDLGPKLKNTPNELIFYDLDPINLKPLSDEKRFFQKICNSF
ncbi:hypothetical protein RB619_05010 [Flavobacterium sp. LHD-80]|uniref:hypothetical protein n=1 Tax=Flavobacterium sp. LHD-80 TaxID=3071411 RepID=UPI0027DF7FEA|nr:hypothetical protein [Flavobacterium sp. LHD-80]MDQ6469996.1 hypothetical protein [Flavobacterium sp. LHD-80]